MKRVGLLILSLLTVLLLSVGMLGCANDKPEGGTETGKLDIAGDYVLDPREAGMPGVFYMKFTEDGKFTLARDAEFSNVASSGDVIPDTKTAGKYTLVYTKIGNTTVTYGEKTTEFEKTADGRMQFLKNVPFSETVEIKISEDQNVWLIPASDYKPPVEVKPATYVAKNTKITVNGAEKEADAYLVIGTDTFHFYFYQEVSGKQPYCLSVTGTIVKMGDAKMLMAGKDRFGSFEGVSENQIKASLNFTDPELTLNLTMDKVSEKEVYGAFETTVEHTFSLGSMGPQTRDFTVTLTLYKDGTYSYQTLFEMKPGTSMPGYEESGYYRAEGPKFVLTAVDEEGALAAESTQVSTGMTGDQPPKFYAKGQFFLVGVDTEKTEVTLYKK